MNEETKKRITAIYNGIIPEGYKKTKVGIVPVEWENVKFSDIFTEKSIRTSDFKKYPLYSLTIEEGVVPKSERYERSHLVKKDDVFKMVSKNDFVYNPMNVRFGALARYKGERTVSVSGYYDVFSVNDRYSMEYMDNFLLSAPMINYYNVVSTGSLKEKQRVHFSQFIEFNLPIPPLPEQQKIAEILGAQDKLIELQERKINQIKTLKKGYLQKMFPKKGCKYPELRFKGFTDAWEEREFSKQYVKVSEKNDLSFGTDKIISVANMYFKEDTKESNDDYMRTYNVMRLGDIAFEGNKSKNFAHGRFVENTIGDGIVSHVFDVFRPIADYDLLFWKYIINNEGVMGRIMTRCTKASTMMTNLVADDFLKEKIAVPSLEEQRQIGSFLNGLDNLITLHQRKLDEEKQKKKALMQLLLTGKVRCK